MKKICQNTTKYKQKLKKIVDYYEKQRLSLLYKNSMKSLGKLKKILVYDRNIRISETITEQINVGSLFIAVGAGHLPGKYGIIRLLKQKGFTVKPMKIVEKNQK